MPTSGTSIFNLDLNNLIEEAFERCGSELRSGYDLRTARRTLNLLTIEWANRGINLWTIEQGTIPLVTGQAIYPSSQAIRFNSWTQSYDKTPGRSINQTSISATLQSPLIRQSRTNWRRAALFSIGSTVSLAMKT
jgi:hypothetical protein